MDKFEGEIVEYDTVSYHIQENCRKLNVDDKADALLSARSLGLIRRNTV